LVKKTDSYDLRWFTPSVEVDLCGHATLASAHILWSENFEPEGRELKFDTRSGRLSAVSGDGWITLNFPSDPPQQAPVPNGLLEALYPTVKVVPEFSGRTKFDWLLRVSRTELVRNVSPNMEALARLTERGVMITARAGRVPEYDGAVDFISRFFAPAAGIPEDPVTGSAHCALGPYWKKELGKSELTAYQASKRGGVLKVSVAGDRTFISGKAVTVFDLSSKSAAPKR